VTDALRERAEELYGLLPEEFTAARTAAVKQARDDGDRPLAKALQALRRPTVAAWSVNLLARRWAELVEQVVGLGGSLREAQAMLQGEALRELTRQRRQLVAAVTQEARALAAAEGQKLSDAAIRQVEETLQAAMADPAAAEAVRSGLLAQPLASTGLESLAEVLAVPPDLLSRSEPEPAGEKPTLSVVRDDTQAIREADQRVEEAGVAVRAAHRLHAKAVKKQAKVQAKVLQLEARVEELRTQLAEAEEKAEAAVEKVADADAAVEEAKVELDDAQAEAEQALAHRRTLD
jgi:hypothetical protein